MRAWNTIMVFALVAGAFVVTATGSDRGRGRHGQLYVVPPSGSVTIDGKLDEWDLSGRIEIFVQEATRATQSARIALMHDAEALYVSGEVHDPSPMMNRHDPQVRPHRAWDADAFQLRLVVDRKTEYPVMESAFHYRGRNAQLDTRGDIVHMLLWHYTDAGSANLQMHHGMGYRSPREEWGRHGLVPYGLFQGAYRKWDDGRGYTFEYRIPWSTMGAQSPPSGGDTVAGTMQIHWSRPDGLATGGGNSWAYDVMRAPGFPFQSTGCWGRLIFTEAGNVPKELVQAGLPPTRELPLEFEYTLPGDGEATVQIMDAAGIVRRIIVAQEQRPGGLNIERWDGFDNHALVDNHGDFIQPGEYQWRGTFNPERLRAEYRFSVHSSGQPPYHTDDGKGGWGGDHGTPQDVAALDDGLLLSWSAAEHGYPIIKVDLTGRKVWGSSGRGIHANFIATDGERVFYNSGQNVEMLAVSDSRPTSLPGGATVLVPPAGGADGQNRISGIAYHDGIIYVAYGPRGLIARFDGREGSLVDTWTLDRPGRMAALADGAMAVISGERVVRVSGGAVSDWLRDHTSKPAGIAVDAAGRVYVANRGMLQNVSVFNADGTYLRGIGREGGRPAMGAYDPTGIYMPGGIAVDAAGKLWVAETTDGPKRISVWDPESGANLKEFFGAAAYFAHGHIDPATPHEIYANNVLWEIDWEKYTTRPKTTIWRRTDPNMAPAPDVSAQGGGFTMATADNGTQFGWGRSSGMFVYLRDDDLFRPIAGQVSAGDYPALAAAGKTSGSGQFFWSDANGDGRVDVDEVHVTIAVGELLQIDRHLNLWFSCGRRLAPAAVVEGRPIYDPAHIADTPLRGKFTGWRSHYGWNLLDEHGYAFSSHVVAQGESGPGFSMVSPEGQLVWRFPDMVRWRDAINLPSGAPGRLWGATQIHGVGDDFLALQTYVGVTHIFRRDGMYVGAVLGGGPSGRRDVSRKDDRYAGQPEGQGGSFVKLKIGGKDRYFLMQGGHDVKVWEILGLDTLQDLPGGTYVHTAAHLELAQDSYNKYLAVREGIQTIRIAAGGHAALENAEPVRVRIEGNEGFTARMAYDAENLYVHYEVEAEHELVNAQADPQIVFRGGNLIDIQLAADPKADPERTAPAPGDIRLLVTRQAGKPYAVLFRPRVAGFEGERIVLTSPTGKEPFDAINVVDWVEMDYTKTDLGFRASLRIPLREIGLALSPGDKLRMDLGYVFGNSQGTRARRRAYLNNSSFSANVVDDIPNESRMEPAHWGEVTFE